MRNFYANPIERTTVFSTRHVADNVSGAVSVLRFKNWVRRAPTAKGQSMDRLRRPLGAVFLAAAALLSVAVPRQASAADPGVTSSEILIGMWAPLTGTQALIGTSERDGIQIGIDEVNRAGGVNGRKLRMIVYDDAGAPQESLSAVRRLLDQDQVFALIAGSNSGATLAAMPVINRAKAPFIASIAAHRNLFVPFSPTSFRVYANEVAQAERIVDYSLAELKVKKPAMIYTSNDYGVGGMETVTAALRKAGIEPAATVRYNQGDQDFSAQLLRIRQSGADSLYVWSFAAEAGIIVRLAKELGLNVPMMGGGATTTPLFPQGAGQAGVGFAAPWVFPYTEAMVDVPAIAAYHDLLKKVYPSGLPAARPSLYDLAGYGAIKILIEGLRRIDGEPTREKFVKALETMKDFDTGVLFPVTFTATNHEGSSQTKIIKVDGSLKWQLQK
jgi:branched-chain amino acid transport system substrate-binding protein